MMKENMEFTHVANPVRVHAAKIQEVTEEPDGKLVLKLNDRRCILIDKSMTARHFPIFGDYFVTQEDGYEYINPKAVFERKYSPIES